jgi:hypothetical protein
MRKLTALLFVVAAFVATTGSASAQGTPTVGDRLNLFAPPATFPADTPFHVNHGWICDPASDCLDPGTRFELLVDGVDVPAAHNLVYDPQTPSASSADVSNFRFGLLAGPHVFEGRWYADGVLELDLVETIVFQ